jgi:large subunit ribosomal protein L25
MSKNNKELRAQLRTAKGKRAAARARKEGLIPVEVYGSHSENQSLLVDAVEWDGLTRADHDINLMDLVTEDGKVTVLVKEIQYSVINRDPIHIDFQAVKMDEEISTAVAIHALPGDPVGLSHGGLLEQIMHEVEISCLPTDLPESIMVDISGLDVDDSLLVKDLPVIKGVTYNHDEIGVVFMVAQQAAAVSEEEAEEAEGAAPAETEAEEE